MSEVAEFISVMVNMSDAMSRVGIKYGCRMLGKTWEAGNYWLGSYCYLESGLHAVSYVVIERDSGAYLGHGGTKAAAIGRARRSLALLQSSVAELIRAVSENRDAEIAQFESELDAARRGVDLDAPIKRIPKRRLAIFNKSEGKCHYCSTPLDLRGKWHIEHMMPKALLGSDDPSNLVASCVTCNMKKKDKTAEEFIAERAAKDQTETA